MRGEFAVDGHGGRRRGGRGPHPGKEGVGGGRNDNGEEGDPPVPNNAAAGGGGDNDNALFEDNVAIGGCLHVINKETTSLREASAAEKHELATKLTHRRVAGQLLFQQYFH